jgi:hypothetical protein
LKNFLFETFLFYFWYFFWFSTFLSDLFCERTGATHVVTENDGLAARCRMGWREIPEGKVKLVGD